MNQLLLPVSVFVLTEIWDDMWGEEDEQILTIKITRTLLTFYTSTSLNMSELSKGMITLNWYSSSMI